MFLAEGATARSFPVLKGKNGDKCCMPNKNLFEACNTETLAMDIPTHRTNIGLAMVTKRLLAIRRLAAMVA